MKLYNDAMGESRAIGESRDCTVKAISISTGVSYGTAHAALAARGRKPRRGCLRSVQENALRDLGWTRTATIVDEQYAGAINRSDSIEGIGLCEKKVFIDHYPSPHNRRKNVTPGQATHYGHTKGWQWLKELSFRDDIAILVWVRGHVAAFKDGEVQDWSVNRKLRVIEIGIFTNSGAEIEFK